MRKGTKKSNFPRLISNDVMENLPKGEAVDLLLHPEWSIPSPIEEMHRAIYAIIPIIASICDACHEMDNKTEPWATIRRDIERLK